MKDRGKGVEYVYRNEFYTDYSCSSSDLPCKKHPSASSVGICAYCLKERLVNLVCSDCGEQRLSSCSCSEISSNRNSCTVDVGSVGRISFLLENDQRNEVTTNPNSKSKSSEDKAEEVFMLKRSSSSCVEMKRKNGFWRIGRLFRKKRDKDQCGKSANGVDEKSELWVVDYMGVSRSRSLCSFRGGGFFGSEDGGDLMAFSGARSSISAARSSSVFDAERKSGFSEAEPRRSGFDSDQQKRDSAVTECEFGGSEFKRRVFSLKESYFTGGEDSGFIDLKFEFSSETKPELTFSTATATTGNKISDTNSGVGVGVGVGNVMRGADFAAHEYCGGGRGGPCRISVSDRGIKRSRKSFKGWRWIFKQHPSTRKKNYQDDLMVKP